MTNKYQTLQELYKQVGKLPFEAIHNTGDCFKILSIYKGSAWVIASKTKGDLLSPITIDDESEWKLVEPKITDKADKATEKFKSLKPLDLPTRPPSTDFEVIGGYVKKGAPIETNIRNVWKECKFIYLILRGQFHKGLGTCAEDVISTNFEGGHWSKANLCRIPQSEMEDGGAAWWAKWGDQERWDKDNPQIKWSTDRSRAIDQLKEQIKAITGSVITVNSNSEVLMKRLKIAEEAMLAIVGLMEVEK